MLGKTQNPELQEIEQSLQEKVKPEDQNALQRIVAAGMKVMYSPQTHQMMVNQLSSGQDPAEAAGEGAAKLMAILWNQSKQTMPPQLIGVAGQILLCEGLDFMERSGQVQLTPDIIAAATKAFGAYLLQLFHIDASKLNSASQQNAPQQSAGILRGAMK